MDFSKVKLIVTDMDGTLLNSKHEMSEDFFLIYKSLQNKGVHFAAASGRQHHSIEEKLLPIKDEITIISENGGLGRQGTKELFTVTTHLEVLLNAIAPLKKIKNTAFVLCGKKYAYFERTNLEHATTILQYYSNYKIVDNFADITQDSFFKVAIYHKECSKTHLYPLTKKNSADLQVIISGKNWLDISHKNANKGNAVALLQKKLNVKKSETMVFGDYNNDLKMLAEADFSFAMKNAHPNVKEMANYETLSNDERGVEHILKQVINSN
ncbi:MAG: HAD family hydrolase [Flavicella sp.]